MRIPPAENIFTTRGGAKFCPRQTSSLSRGVYIRWRILKYGNKSEHIRLRDNALPATAIQSTKCIFFSCIYINARAAHNQATGCPRFYRRRRMKMRLAAAAAHNRSHSLIAINFISTRLLHKPHRQKVRLPNSATRIPNFKKVSTSNCLLCLHAKYTIVPKKS
jgi:hypothetical protein